MSNDELLFVANRVTEPTTVTAVDHYIYLFVVNAQPTTVTALDHYI